MRSDRADDVRWWFERIAFYLAAWILADLVAFWVKGDLSRTFVVLDLACSVLALLAVNAIMRKVHGEGEPPRSERAR